MNVLSKKPSKRNLPFQTGPGKTQGGTSQTPGCWILESTLSSKRDLVLSLDFATWFSGTGGKIILKKDACIAIAFQRKFTANPQHLR